MVAEARQRYRETEAYQSVLQSKYRKAHFWYAPPNDDHWPEDAARRPGKIHVTTNVIKPVVDIEARLQAKLPRVVLVPADLSQAERARAELAEKIMVEYLEASGWEYWLHSLTRTRAIYGKGVLHPFWNKKEKRPDVRIIENPGNLRLGWGASDFSVLDWAIYEYSLSPQEVMRRWDVLVLPTPGGEPLNIIPRQIGSHDDPLAQDKVTPDPTLNFSPSDYEKKQVKVWDYWYKKGDDVYNCVLLQEVYHALPPTKHAELIDIPYIVIENDHEPGTPEGLSSVTPLVDLQIEMNREISHWNQIIADELDPAWWASADSIPGGVVPRAGEIVPLGDDVEAHAFEKPVQTFPIEQLHNALWNQLHRTSGIPEIAFGNPGGSQVSGRALAVQIEGTINRLDPKRTLLYGGLRELLIFWTTMVEKVNPKIEVAGEGDATEKVPLGRIFKNFRRWRLIAPEITPRDVAEHTTNTINKVNAGLLSRKNGMDELGVDSPMDELAQIAEEQTNIDLSPGTVQQKVAVLAAIQQMQLAASQLASAVQGSTAVAAAQDQTGANNDKARRQQAIPTLDEAENQPATGPGGVPPLDVAQTTLVRADPQGNASTLNQLAINR